MCFILLLFISCSPSADKIVDYKMLIGEWELNSETQINYPLIEFKSDSTAIFKSKADTIYRYDFILKGDTLILINSFNVKSSNKINFLNNLGDLGKLFCSLHNLEKYRIRKDKFS